MKDFDIRGTINKRFVESANGSIMLLDPDQPIPSGYFERTDLSGKASIGASHKTSFAKSIQGRDLRDVGLFGEEFNGSARLPDVDLGHLAATLQQAKELRVRVHVMRGAMLDQSPEQRLLMSEINEELNQAIIEFANAKKRSQSKLEPEIQKRITALQERMSAAASDSLKNVGF